MTDTDGILATALSGFGKDYRIRRFGPAQSAFAPGFDTQEQPLWFAMAAVINGTSGNDTIDGGADDDTISGRAGNDIISGAGGADLIDGGNGSDRIDGGSGNDTISGGKDRDRVLGGTGDDLIDGGAGDDALAGASGNDTIDGGDGDDTLDGDAGADMLHGDAGGDTLFGQVGDDQLFGDDGNDELYGDDGADRLEGGAGNDELEGDAGADTLVGGAGNDAFIFFLGSFNPSSPFRAHDTILDFEGAGVAGGDRIDLTGNDFVFAGEQMFDPVEGAALSGGGDGVTQLFYTFSGGNTVLVADENDNGVLDASDFTLTLNGLHTLTQDDFTDALFITAGTADDDTLTGTARADRIAGLAGNDRIDGLAGDDTLQGGDGNDVILAGRGFDDISGGNGNDQLILGQYGSAAGGAGDDRLFASGLADSFNVLDGGDGNDILFAEGGGANMQGGRGADRLIGGEQGDAMTGGTGRDSFIFGAVWGQDFIIDFEDGVERMDLSGSGLAFADLTITGNDFQTFIASSAGSITLSVPVQTITAADFIFG